MLQFRRPISLARGSLAVLVVALAFAWISPWQLALSLSVGILVPIFVSGLRWIEIGTIVATTVIAGLLTLPPASNSDHIKSRNRIAQAEAVRAGPMSAAPAKPSPGAP
ncbi:hypothetical protein V5E97_12265 [Singulisphaera sp. Ch08]|uniref:Uncharacterized protein n=1 Tax=Singulisphaera sp. Ch08 TaxID=3120278 RepID=A0AAU7CP43_9BACT